MKTAIAIVLGLVVAVGVAVLVFFGDRPLLPSDAAPVTPTAAVDVDADRAAIRELIRRTAEANNDGDVEAWVGGFAPDAVYMPPGSPAVTGTAGIRAMAETGFSGATVDITMVPDEIEVHGDWAFARIRVEGSGATEPDGDPFTVDVKEIVVFERQPDGAWKIARLISNRNRHG